MQSPPRNRWFPVEAPRDVRGVAFCLPFAGGGAGFYRPWLPLAPPLLGIVPVQLPGREERLLEPPFSRMAPLVEALTAELRPRLPERYILFGHSMGALVAYEVAQELRRQGAPAPRRLFVSGAPAPHRTAEVEPIFHLPEPEFLDRLARYGGLPQEVLANRELLDLLVPRLRDDLAITGTYVDRHQPALDCPITAFGGADDLTVTPASVGAWREHTVAGFREAILPGGHFFVSSAVRPILAALAEAVT